MTLLLQVQDLAYHTPDRRPLIRGLNFQLNQGELLTITGPNGIGKSTLLGLLLSGGQAADGRIEEMWGYF